MQSARASSVKVNFHDRFLESTHSASIDWRDGEVSLTYGLRAGCGLRSKVRGGMVLFQSFDDPPADPASLGDDWRRAVAHPRGGESGGSGGGVRVRSLTAGSVADSRGDGEEWDPGGWEREIASGLEYVEEAAAGLSSECRGLGIPVSITGSVHLYHQAVLHETRDRAVRDNRRGARIELRASARGKHNATSRRRQAGRDMAQIVSSGSGADHGRRAGAALIRKLETPARPHGEFPAVFASGGCGALLHEIGHLFEEATFSPALPCIDRGDRIGPADLTVLDDPSACRGRGSYRVDDEGEAGRSVCLIDRGVVSATLGSAGARTGRAERPTGHGRRGSYKDMPIQRMACTYMQPGGVDPESMIEETARGLYIASLAAGELEPDTQRITLIVDEGFLIENGQLTRPLEEMLIVGCATDLIGRIDAIGHDLKFDCGVGDCLKRDQSVPVMVGLPTIRLRVVRVVTP